LLQIDIHLSIVISASFGAFPHN
jgi:hypothetical protein